MTDLLPRMAIVAPEHTDDPTDDITRRELIGGTAALAALLAAGCGVNDDPVRPTTSAGATPPS